MTRDVLGEFKGSAQGKIRVEGRKSLQTLQVSADEKEIAGKNMVLPDDETVPSKKKQLTIVDKVIVAEKENAPILRRSKRKNTISDINYAESPDDPKASKSVSVKSKPKKTVIKLKKERPATLKKNKPEISLNQTKINFSPAISVLTHPEKDTLGISSSSEVKVTEDIGIDPSNGDSSQSPVHSNGVQELNAVKASVSPDEEISILTSVNPPLSYWQEIAEQRRIALEKTLHENELLHDQLIVLEAENSQLKQLLKEAENLAQVVRDIIQ